MNILNLHEIKLVGEVKKKGSKDVGDTICYLFVETNNRVSLTVKDLTVLLPLESLRQWLNKTPRALPDRGVGDEVKKPVKPKRKETRKIKTKHTIDPKKDK